MSMAFTDWGAFTEPGGAAHVLDWSSAAAMKGQWAYGYLAALARAVDERSDASPYGIFADRLDANGRHLPDTGNYMSAFDFAVYSPGGLGYRQWHDPDQAYVAGRDPQTFGWQMDQILSHLGLAADFFDTSHMPFWFWPAAPITAERIFSYRSILQHMVKSVVTVPAATTGALWTYTVRKVCDGACSITVQDLRAPTGYPILATGSATAAIPRGTDVEITGPPQVNAPWPSSALCDYTGATGLMFQ